MNQEIITLIKYRVSRAHETFEEAHLLANANHWNTCVNRLYYSCFYIVLALLLQHNLSSSKHTGVRSLFNIHFVKTKKVSKQIAQIYNDLFERRQESDYEDFVVFKSTDVKGWIQETEKFIHTIETIINQDLS